MSPRPLASEVADDVAIRIEQVHRGNRDICQAALAAGLTQQVGGREHRWRQPAKPLAQPRHEEVMPGRARRLAGLDETLAR